MSESLTSIRNWFYLLIAASFILYNFRPSNEIIKKNIEVKAKNELESLYKVEDESSNFANYLINNQSDTEYLQAIHLLEQIFLNHQIKLNTSLIRKEDLFKSIPFAIANKDGSEKQCRKLLEDWKTNFYGQIYKVKFQNIIDYHSPNFNTLFSQLKNQIKIFSDSGKSVNYDTITIQAIVTNFQSLFFNNFDGQINLYTDFTIDSKAYFEKFHQKGGYTLYADYEIDSSQLNLFKKWVIQKTKTFTNENIDLPATSAMMDEIGHLPISKALDVINERILKPENSVTFLGISVNRQSGLISGPMVILFILFFIILNMIHILKIQKSNNMEFERNPLILFQTHWLANVITYLLMFILPIIILIDLCIEYWNIQNFDFIKFLYPLSIIILFITLISIFKIRKRIISSYPIDKS